MNVEDDATHMHMDVYFSIKRLGGDLVKVHQEHHDYFYHDIVDIQGAFLRAVFS